MNTQDKIKVMQAFINGKTIQFVEPGYGDWADYATGEVPLWDWGTTIYRVKPTESEPNIPDYYNNTYKGNIIDPYRAMLIFGITHPVQQHIFKKVCRMHKENHKSLEQTLDEIIQACNRWKDMEKEA